MSEYGNFIKGVIERSGQPAYEFAAKMGLDPTHLSAFIRGRRVGVNIETLAKMVQGISEEPAVRAGLLEAYFRDQALPEMKDWVLVIPPGKKGRVQEEAEYGSADEVAELAATLRRLALPTPVVRSLQQIVTAMPDHSSLQDLVEELAAFTRDALSG
jgi:transcriptional regulator with XRE-family HTH domain